MKPEDQIKALAEFSCLKFDERLQQWHDTVFGYTQKEPPNYLTSYDAIIPLIQKLGRDVGGKVWALEGELNLTYSPQQLCEALLRATNKWIEE